MPRLGKFPPALGAGWACLVFASLMSFAVCAEPDDTAQLLKQADSIKTSDNARFTQLLKRLDSEANQLSPVQEFYLRYLNAWQVAYRGDYEAAIPKLDAIIDTSKDVTLRFRAGVTVVNVLAIASRNEAAFTHLSHLLDLLPQVSDKEAREQGLGVAAFLYNQAEQYDLAASFADKLLEENGTDKATCLGEHLKLEALYKSGKLKIADEFQPGIDACVKRGELLWANLIRADAANLQIEQDRPADAIRLLQQNYADVQHTHYAELISKFDALLAEAYWQTRDTAQAQQFAQRAIDGSVKKEVTKPLVDGYRVLYLIAQQQGNYQSALAYHEKFATADKGYLTDESAKVLAYQMVHQQVLAKKLQIDALNKQNQVLQLRQAVSKKTAEARSLSLVLLLMMLGSIAFWAWRIKRSELKFMKLARRDGLTGIFNHQYFVDAAGQLLQYCAKSGRDACVLVIDLDHFKLVNDAHGHATGDLVLKRAVAACKAHLRSIDIFGRLGGEEFGITLPDCTLEMAMQQAERLRVAIAGIARADDGPGFPVHASFGVAATDFSGYELRQLMAHADSALYQAKREGRNRVVVFNSAIGVSGGLREETLDRRSA